MMAACDDECTEADLDCACLPLNGQAEVESLGTFWAHQWGAGKDDAAKELQDHAAKTQDTLVGAVGSEIERRFEAGLPANASPGESC